MEVREYAAACATVLRLVLSREFSQVLLELLGCELFSQEMLLLELPNLESLLFGPHAHRGRCCPPGVAFYGPSARGKTSKGALCLDLSPNGLSQNGYG